MDLLFRYRLFWGKTKYLVEDFPDEGLELMLLNEVSEWLEGPNLQYAIYNSDYTKRGISVRGNYICPEEKNHPFLAYPVSVDGVPVELGFGSLLVGGFINNNFEDLTLKYVGANDISIEYRLLILRDATSGQLTLTVGG